jgi:hypothetical protein
MDLPCRISSFSSFKRFFFPGYTSVLIAGYSVDIYKWYFYLMIMDSDKNENFRIYLITEVGFEVITAVSTKEAVFWVVAPCIRVEVYQRFRGLYNPEDSLLRTL